MPGLDDLWFPHLAVFLSDDDKVVRRRSPGSLSPTNDDPSLTGDQGVPPEALLAGADRSVVPDLAERVLAAGPNTRVPTVVVEAGETVGTLPVVLALALPAGDEGVALVAGRTPALGRLSSRETLGVGTAGVGVAGVRLLLAAGDGVGGRDVALDTLTHGVAGTVGAALSVGTTGTGVAGVGWGSDDPQDGAPGDGVGLGGVAGQAGADWVALPVLSALSVGAAGTGRAGVGPGGAPVVVTDIAGATVRVHLALSLTPGDCVRHRYEASQAAADGIALPVLHTHRVGATRGGIARVRPGDTSLALTHIARLTVGVSHTLRATPSDRVGLRDEAGLAPTDWVALHGEVEWVTNTGRDSNLTSKVNRTDGSRAAGTRNTRVGLLHTSLALTDVAALTIRVSDTLRATPSDRVGLRDEAGLTGADSVASLVDVTHSPGTAGGGLGNR